MDRTELVRLAIIRELHRQTNDGGNLFETNGTYGQVDGGFNVWKLARAIDATLSSHWR